MLLLFDNPCPFFRAHDVAVAYLLAMQEARVQLPLDAFCSPNLRCKRLYVVLIQDVGKPGIPRASGARDRGFKSRHPDFFAVGPVLVRAGAC